MSYHYGWRDIGTGLRGIGPEINIIDIGSDNNNESSRIPNDKDYCSTCGCHLIYSDKIKKWFCPEHGCNLTSEEQGKLLNKPTSSINSSEVTPTNTNTTSSPSSPSPPSPFDDIEPGVGGAFIPTQRESGTTGTASGATGSGGASGVISPMGQKKRKGVRKENDGLDWLREPSNDLPANAISILTEVGIPTPAGGFDATTYFAPDKLRERQKEIEMGDLYDNRYEGQPLGDPLDRSIHSSSGLRIGGKSSSSSNNNRSEE